MPDDRVPKAEIRKVGDKVIAELDKLDREWVEYMKRLREGRDAIKARLRGFKKRLPKDSEGEAAELYNNTLVELSMPEPEEVQDGFSTFFDVIRDWRRQLKEAKSEANRAVEETWQDYLEYFGESE